MITATVIVAGGAFGLVVLLVPVVKRLCVRWKLYDWPGPLKPHARPIPRLGGVAVALAIIGGVLLSGPFATTGKLPFIVAVILICIIGAIDDIKGLSAAVRLAAHVIGGAILWFGCGRLPILGNGVLGLLASCALAVAIVNSLNFLDGADGLATGVAGIIGVTYALLLWPAGDRLASAVAWTLAAVCAGFLFSNFPPAKIFLGDSGSTVIGLSIAFLSLSFYRAPLATGTRLLFPLVAAGLPLLDAGFAVTRRVRGRVSPFFGDRRHIYDLIRARGASARKVALVCYAATALLCLIGLIGVRAKPALLILSSAGVGALLIPAIRLGALQLDTERVRQDRKSPAGQSQ